MIEESIQSTIGMVTALSLDVVVLFVCAVLFMIAGAAAGRREELALALSPYPTLAFLVARPDWPPIQTETATLAVFVVSFVGSYLILRRFIGGMFPYTRLHMVIEMTALGVAGAGAMIAVGAATGALLPLYKLSSTTAWVFESPWSLFLWLLSPLLVLGILVRR